MRDDEFFPKGIIWVVGIAKAPNEPEREENPGRKLQIDALCDRLELQLMGIKL